MYVDPAAGDRNLDEVTSKLASAKYRLDSRPCASGAGGEDRSEAEQLRLSAGDLVPADVRLVSSRDLFVSQAALTGEALPVEKHDTLGIVAEKAGAGPAPERDGNLDLANICFLGTNVVSGTATAVVIATG